MIANMASSLFAYTILIALSFYVVRTWLRWFRSEVKLCEPRWRSSITTVGFAATTVSLVVIAALAFHALITGGLPYYHPVLMFAFGFGFLTAAFGSIAAMIGTGQLEEPTIVCSVLCLLIWLVEAVAQ